MLVALRPFLNGFSFCTCVIINSIYKLILTVSYHNDKVNDKTLICTRFNYSIPWQARVKIKLTDLNEQVISTMSNYYTVL